MSISCDDIFFEMYAAIPLALLGVMMDIQYVNFNLLPVDSRLWTCGKPPHFCPQLSKLPIIS